MFDSDGGDELSEIAGRALVRCRLGADAVGHLAGVDVAALSGADLRELTARMEQLRRVLDAAECHTLAELDRRRHTDLLRGQATSKWLAHRAHLPAGVARARLALARRLAEDPALAVVAEALDSGRVGVDHAKVLAGAINERNGNVLTPVLGDLLDASQAMVFEVWKQHVEHLAAMADPDGSHDPDDDVLGNTLTLSPSNGFMLIRGELAGEHAISVADTLNAIADELFHQHSRDAETTDGATRVPPRSTLLALALEEICRRALGTDTSTTKKAKVEATLTIHASSDGDHLDIWAIHHHLLGPIPAAHVPAFLCDTSFHAVMLDTLGVSLDAGRDHRHPTAAQRRALLARDGSCTFPGCDAHVGWLDAHHVRHWRNGGPTDLSNLVLLCRRHHRIAHRHGWALELTHDGWTRWTAPDGRTFWGQRHHHQRAGP